MFDFAWSEIALIVVVAVIFIGPKDLPVAIKAVTGMLKKARRMAGEFQTHVDDMVREADLGEVRDGLNKIRNFDFKGTVERAVDPDRALRDSFSTPFEPTPFEPVGAAAPTPHVQPVAAHDLTAIDRPAGVDGQWLDATRPGAEIAPAFIPPGFVRPGSAQPCHAAAKTPAEPPAFIPPNISG